MDKSKKEVLEALRRESKDLDSRAALVHVIVGMLEEEQSIEEHLGKLRREEVDERARVFAELEVLQHAEANKLASVNVEVEKAREQVLRGEKDIENLTKTKMKLSEDNKAQREIMENEYLIAKAKLMTELRGLEDDITTRRNEATGVKRDHKVALESYEKFLDSIRGAKDLPIDAS